MRRLIERYGGRPLMAPSMQEVPLQDNSEVLQFGERLLADHLDMVILLTGVGTRVMLDVLLTRYSVEQITGALERTVLVVRGPKPKAVLREFGLAPSVDVPEPNTWRDIIEALDRGKPVAGLRIAVQEYGVINAELIEGLRGRGAQVTRVPVYRWTLPDDLTPFQNVLDAILEGRVDVLLVTNAVQIDHAWQVLAQPSRQDQFRRALGNVVVASIGPTATERLRSYGFSVDLEPSHPRMGILVKESAERAGRILQDKREP
ncbi:MAG TPA: uroporphyrinogen-III synthase [Nitrospiraceae bacterium]|nr:uroporphyrinogen-III synthase [Nitrospiraceae bacterium]